MHIGIGMIPSEIVPKGNQYEMFNSLLEWIRRFKAKISREFNRFRNDCILVNTNFRFESCTHKSQHVFTEKIRFSSIYITKHGFTSKFLDFGQVNIIFDEKSCKFKL